MGVLAHLWFRLAPLGPLDMCVVGSFFLMRELSYLLWGQVSFDEKARFARLHLSVSKTGPRGLGCFRKWECVCSASLASPCPYHAMLRQRDRVLATWPAPSGMPHHELPVFPDTGGGHPSKESVVRALEAIAEATGEPLLSTVETGGSAATPCASSGPSVSRPWEFPSSLS